MFFFSILIGACVGAQLGELSPLDIQQQRSGLSLIETAKNDPRALIKMLDGANKDTLTKVIKLLNELRGEAIAEQNRLETSVATATVNLGKGQKELRRLEGVESEKKAALDDATRDFNIANGKYIETQREHDEGVPGLNNEIKVFGQVLTILRKLLAGQPQSKSLLEFGFSAQAEAWQRMIDNAKADPAKLKKVIDLVEKLLTQSKSELALLKSNLARAVAVKGAMEKAMNAAKRAYEMAKAATAAQRRIVNVLQGELNEAQKEYAARYPVVSKERKTLEEVISVLKGMLADQK